MSDGLRIGELFAGYGGLGAGVQAVLGGEIAWFSEFDKAPSRILAHHWPTVPNHGDITKIDWSTVEPVDILTGGFPCQDVSLAGARAGLKEGTRSGLWSEFARAIAALQPRLVVIENVRGLLSATAGGSVEPDPWGVGDGATRPVINALGAVLGDLAELGYDADWCGVRAADAGAPHARYRVFILAHSSGARRGQGEDPRASSGDEGTRSRSLEPQRGSRERTDATQDADLAASGQRGQSTPGQTQSGRTRADAGRRSGAPVPDPTGCRCDGGTCEQVGCEVGRASAPRSGENTAPDTSRERFGQHPGEPSKEEAGPGSSHVSHGPGGLRTDTNWGPYAPAIRRWEAVIGRSATAPTAPSDAYLAMVVRRKAGLDRRPVGMRGSLRPRQVLSARFVEWMMGLDEGHVTNPAIGLTRNEQLKALGNGVVPQQAALALRVLLSRERMLS